MRSTRVALDERREENIFETNKLNKMVKYIELCKKLRKKVTCLNPEIHF